MLECTLKRFRRVINGRSSPAGTARCSLDMNTNNRHSLNFTRDSILTVVPTDVAAAALNRRPQTLRQWACLENGPIRPVRINGRLAWRVVDIQALLGEETA